MTRPFRIGQIVPSSNTTMETEIPAMLRAREAVRPGERFTFHSSRMRMHQVTPEELAAMNQESLRCAAELADARVDVITRGVDAVVASACVQMQSLASVQAIEDMLGIPTVSTAVCTVRGMLEHLGLEPVVPGAGRLLADATASGASAG